MQATTGTRPTSAARRTTTITIMALVAVVGKAMAESTSTRITDTARPVAAVVVLATIMVAEAVAIQDVDAGKVRGDRDCLGGFAMRAAHRHVIRWDGTLDARAADSAILAADLASSVDADATADCFPVVACDQAVDRVVLTVVSLAVAETASVIFVVAVARLPAAVARTDNGSSHVAA